VSACAHPSGSYLYPATDPEGFELAIFRCDECGAKYAEGA
jgi:hypothetical protein